MTDERPASTDDSQKPPPVASEAEADHDEQDAEAQSVEASRLHRPRIAADHDEGSYAITPERQRQ